MRLCSVVGGTATIRAQADIIFRLRVSIIPRICLLQMWGYVINETYTYHSALHNLILVPFS